MNLAFELLMTLRRFCAGIFLLASCLLMTAAGPAPASSARASGSGFSYNDVVTMARKLADKPYAAPVGKLPSRFQNLTYDQYRDIRFRADRAIWKDAHLPFQLQLFHRGLYYPDKVEIYVVSGGKPVLVTYAPDLFSFGPVAAAALQKAAGSKPATTDSNLGFAGFRIHAPINRADYFDEVAVFLGASYFRAVGRGEAYGLSARGLAINTAEPKGEEFPRFTTFWIEQPVASDGVINVNALLDSASVAGAYRFTINPGAATVMNVTMTLYPRVRLDHVGIAPMSSMFYFGPNDHSDTDDFRPAVHDSDGLEMYSGRGEWIWRPLSNPSELQISAFMDSNPKGFGLLQRGRNFADYEDLEANYERRPSLWVEPQGDWGAGNVILIEIPTDAETHDNIVAFWRPRTPVAPGKAYSLSYNLYWSDNPPLRPSLAQVDMTRVGEPWGGGRGRIFVIDYTPEVQSADSSPPQPAVSASSGTVSNIVVQPNPHSGGWRLSFQLDPGNAPLVELRAALKRSDAPITETWLYRWTR
ncbi:MAG TPA: glucan biosynthesis protein G [Alphaproteobacteria bacterium]|nr:glucan biosynthesis protein G [Alphaproteobacteria bacterium]